MMGARPGARPYCSSLSSRDKKHPPPMALHLRLQRVKPSAYRKFSGVSGWRADLAEDLVAAMFEQPDDVIPVSRARLAHWLARVRLIVVSLERREGDAL